MSARRSVGNCAMHLVNLDTVRMVEAIRGIAEQNPALGDALVYHVNQLAYTKILQSLKTDVDHYVKEARYEQGLHSGR